jgi:cytochrome c biogenesis protein CcdA
MMRSANASELGTALAGGFSSGIHALFGDAKGTIGYWTVAGIPVRSSLTPLVDRRHRMEARATPIGLTSSRYRGTHTAFRALPCSLPPEAALLSDTSFLCE